MIRRLPAAVLLLALSFLLGAQSLRDRGASLLQAGRPDEARALAMEALAADPSDPEAAVLLGQSLLALGRTADAQASAIKAWDRKKDPRLAEIAGEALYALGRNPEALEWFRLYLSALPEGPLAGLCYYYTGEVYLRLGSYGHADIALATAVLHSPGNARWWSRLGWAQEKAGDVRQALASYEAALAIDPRLDDALLGKARVLARLRG